MTFTKNSIALHEMPDTKWRLEDEEPAQVGAPEVSEEAAPSEDPPVTP